MRRAVVLFTRDLRLHDNPALFEASRAAVEVVPLFVLDPRLAPPPNRAAFLADCLADIDGLVVRHGDPVAAIRECAPDAVFLSEDVSAYAQRRLARLREAFVDVRAFPGVTIVPPGDVTPAGRDHYRVFTPYWNAWRQAPRRAVLPKPGLRLAAVERGELPPAEPESRIPRGGETAARERLRRFRGDADSGLSPYLHFGCVSPLEVEQRAPALARSLCWRDFHHQLLAARPETEHEDIRPRGIRWRDDPAALEAWKRGETGVPLVDAGMRQLLAEGFVPNRVRMVVASYLTKDLRIDWREGARHFAHWLVDADVANNVGNWQWVAGTGTDTRPNRRLNPERQAKKLDPDGSYVARWLG